MTANIAKIKKKRQNESQRSAKMIRHDSISVCDDNLTPPSASRPPKKLEAQPLSFVVGPHQVMLQGINLVSEHELIAL